MRGKIKGRERIRGGGHRGARGRAKTTTCMSRILKVMVGWSGRGDDVRVADSSIRKM